MVIFLITEAGASFTRDDYEKILNAKTKRVQPAHLAAVAGSTECLEFLIKNGADPSAKNDEGRTAAHVAAEHGHKQILKYLLQHEIKLDEPDNSGLTPAKLAKKGEGFDGLISAIIKREDWDLAITWFTEAGASFTRDDFEKILNTVFTLDMTTKREAIIDNIKEHLSFLFRPYQSVGCNWPITGCETEWGTDLLWNDFQGSIKKKGEADFVATFMVNNAPIYRA